MCYLVYQSFLGRTSLKKLYTFLRKILLIAHVYITLVFTFVTYVGSKTSDEISRDLAIRFNMQIEKLFQLVNSHSSHLGCLTMLDNEDKCGIRLLDPSIFCSEDFYQLILFSLSVFD